MLPFTIITITTIIITTITITSSSFPLSFLLLRYLELICYQMDNDVPDRDLGGLIALGKVEATQCFESLFIYRSRSDRLFSSVVPPLLIISTHHKRPHTRTHKHMASNPTL